MDHHTATEQAIASMIAETKCNIFKEEYPSFYSLQRHKISVHVKTSRIQIDKVNLDAFIADYHNQALRQELTSCQHFLVDSAFVRGRQYVLFNFAPTIVTPKFLQEKVQQIFESLHCAAKVNSALSFVLRKVEDEICPSVYAHENK